MATLLGMLGTSLPAPASVVRVSDSLWEYRPQPQFPDNHLAQVSEIADFQRVARAENATLVQYSLLEDAGGNSILMWVIPPEGEIEFLDILTALKNR
ncbi:MAG TPA: hypothetical protein IGS17_15990 [Oscillatoriales cyanobacterium M59_W2019_021]|nr:hypothetical protein [Oscillatoriales cyanobacterium M59_W2019_021]